MTGMKYEVGRQCLERGDLDLARRYFREATKLDKGFLPARIGFGELLIREGKLKQAAESWEKSYGKTGNPLFLQRLEDLYLEMGEPGEMLRIYQVALSRNDQNPFLKLALGKLYYRLEMIDDAFDLLSTLEGLQDPTGALHKIMACLYIRKGDTESPLMILQGALNRPQPVGAPLACTACHNEAREWSGRCQVCGRWNTLALVLPSFGGAGQPHPYPGVASPFEPV